jgi:hypothetical protein
MSKTFEYLMFKIRPSHDSIFSSSRYHDVARIVCLSWCSALLDSGINSVCHRAMWPMVVSGYQQAASCDLGPLIK